MAIPDSNNVYGHFIAPDGLLPVQQVVKRLVGDGGASIYRSQFDGDETLHISTETVNFESITEGNGAYLLNGGVSGTVDEVVGFVNLLSNVLTEVGIEHGFEVYDGQTLVKRVGNHDR